MILKQKRYTVTDDLEIIDTLVETMISVSQFRFLMLERVERVNLLGFLYAMAIDLDGVDTWMSGILVTQIDKGHEMLSFVWGFPDLPILLEGNRITFIFYI